MTTLVFPRHNRTNHDDSQLNEVSTVETTQRYVVTLPCLKHIFASVDIAAGSIHSAVGYFLSFATGWMMANMYLYLGSGFVGTFVDLVYQWYSSKTVLSSVACSAANRPARHPIPHFAAGLVVVRRWAK